MINDLKKAWEDFVLVKSLEENIDVTQEELTCSPNGQWSLKKATLHIPDHWAEEFRAEQAAKAKGQASPKALSDNSAALNDMFHRLNSATMNGNRDEAENVAKDIHNHVVSSPKGSIDIGHLGNLVDKSQHGRVIGHARLEAMIKPHIQDVNSLDEIHRNFGGDDALRTVMRVHGANGSVMQNYDKGTHMFKNPKVLGDLVNAVHPHKGSHIYDSNGNAIETNSDHLNTDWDEGLHNNVLDTWSKAYANDWDDKSMKDYENAVVERGLDHLKRHYGL